MEKSRVTEIMNSENDTQSRTTEIMSNVQESNLNHSYITIGSLIGDGYTIEEVIAENTGEATIFKCAKGEEKYVAKVYHRYKKTNAEILQNIKSINSPYVIKILDDGETHGRYFEILPLYSKGDLLKALPNSDFIRNKFIPSINEGLHSIHEQGIIHRDIKPNNIFYSNDGQTIVIGDFGISSNLNTGMSCKVTSTSRTAGYAAPEIYNGIVSKEYDYYSLGITLLHLILEKDPFDGLNDQQILIITSSKKLKIPSHIDESLARLIKGLTVKDRTNRWGYEEVNKWIRNEYVEIIDDVKQKNSVVPYRFIDDNEYFQLEDLMIAFAQNWEEGKKHLYRGYLKRHMEDDFRSYGANLCSLVEDCMEEIDQDLGLFRLIYSLNKNAPLCWKNKIYGDIISFVDGVLETFPNIDDYYQEILRMGIISYYLEVKEYEKEIIQLAKEYEKEEDIEIAYFKLIYLLDPSQPLHWRGKIYISLDDLADSIGKVYMYKVKNDDAKELLLLGALEYFLKINELNDLSNEIEKIRKEYGKGIGITPSIFSIIYVLNPEAPFYFASRSFKGTLELYETLIKIENPQNLISNIRYIIEHHLLYDFFKLNGYDSLARSIQLLNEEKNDTYVQFKFMDLLNSDSQYYFESDIIDIDIIIKEILSREVFKGGSYIKLGFRYMKILDSIGDYYLAKGKTEKGNKLNELKAANTDILEAIVEYEKTKVWLISIGRLYDGISEILFKMLYIMEPLLPFWWQGKTYSGMNEIIDLALIELQNNKEGVIYKILQGGYLSYFFEAKGLQDEVNRVKAVEKIRNNPYKSLSYLIFLYRPNAPMILNKQKISGIIELKKLLTNNLDEHKDHKNRELIKIKQDIISLIETDILYKKLISSIETSDNQSAKIINWNKDLSETNKTKSESVFWRLYFKLDGRDIFYYNKMVFTDTNQLIDFILDNNAGQISNISKNILNDIYFKEWIRSMGWEIP